jgi:hypothetical protein|tara:strand:+ start:2058 stop:2357 length:300 start_codon:yes stop_codon:yes gene_type:complete
MQKYILLLFIFVGCGEENVVYEPQKTENIPLSVSDASTNLLWVCHNPTSSTHGKECAVINGQHNCLVPGDQTKFCWLLSKSDCYTDAGLLYSEICQNYN